jgi:uncharacterized OB-fold protein
MRGLPPLISEVSQPYWQGLDAGEIRLQCRAGCNRSVFYPRRHCPHCSGRNLL